MLPIFATLNKFAGSFVSLFVILALWYTNAFQTAYLPLNTNRLYDNRGRPYNVTRAIDSVGIFSPSKYEKYSPPFLTAGNINIYVFYFALYTAVFTYALLYHHHEMKLGFLELYNSFFKRQKKDASRYEDVHNRLMSAYSDGELTPATAPAGPGPGPAADMASSQSHRGGSALFSSLPYPSALPVSPSTPRSRHPLLSFTGSSCASSSSSLSVSSRP